MQVILLETIKNLGDLGSVVDVRPGYGRNFLIPQGKALPATKNNLAEVEERRAELEKQAAELLSAAEARAEKLAEATITVGAKSGDEGKLFGSVGTANIADAISEQTGVAVEKAEVKLPLGAIRQTGEYEIDLSLHADVTVTIKLTVVPQE
ncbi:MAG: 50S ribosomal protein L9 [Alcanivorax sp.]|jgi:large subunit ribosomal protein L9|uniref:Large ribosomal subunit protein bL9 n=1 Tax=Alloalcanivorax venustensis ISO4 TaxID=1177184 RepID=A0ABS0AI31_9GAMM|nr:50S ribosomal protein L9 [Alloalcanivorax venustensis]MAD71163.1 50S ribosomal protein L9 [Alcanivorax sp.]MCH9783397.1 50S ribosomal protein L9 [Gammaproteobacteria bacterium]MEA3260933.1 50S ribosomal protein L9 [Pseudomonadota bacterium]SMO35228.1 LSU ribosomal protein L9P [Alcanivorax sp. DSM 26295]MAK23510.1 50S ribosomal protein L9 [Alcanivorax sp.]|tara:strand:+ start:63537 stop:63989 length:453 start_codon:yes stop_codon:yes gene_type:complete